jgi:hypothetical protein
MLALTAQQTSGIDLLPSAQQRTQGIHLSERAKKSYLKSLKAKRKAKR